MRYAVRRSERPVEDARVMARYMPSNYSVSTVTTPGGTAVLITGEDNAGWTLDGFVLPRLASGLWSAVEVTETETLDYVPLDEW